ncbi:SAP domain-containing protein [uncultured Halomonas sp.]|uniref:SAP domain-containing protein n=1 Tax=uncultured Halomonas sp. TaxID=173971 RepID=UPI00262D5EDD|nr:SAP domain-containing protein [uncultured Halomonas sp.]
MKKTLDRTKRLTQVGGRQPLVYLQDGHGFDADGRCLGRFTDQGEPAGEPEPPAPVAPEVPRPSVDHVRPKVGDEAPAEDLHALTVIELRERCRERGIGTTGLNKAALIEALEA